MIANDAKSQPQSHPSQQPQQVQANQPGEDVIIHPKSINNIDYQQIVASLIDMRVDLKLEIQKLSNRVNKIDEHIA